MTRQEFLIHITKDTRSFNLNETLAVLNMNKPIFWSWGVQSLSGFEDKVLFFKVSGHHHKGMVYITLDGNDTYIVTIATTHNNVLKTYKDVYFDMLVDVIDTHIERIPEYTK